jgi:hypothetical protein
MAIKFNQVILNKLQKNKTKLSKKVDLSLLDDFSFGQYNELEEQVSNLSYNVNEWFPEKFDQWYDIGRDIYAIYFQNAEPFPTETDFNNDLEIIEEIYRKSEELGISADTIYPSIEEHKRLCEEGQGLLAEFASQGEEFLRESKSV